MPYELIIQSHLYILHEYLVQCNVHTKTILESKNSNHVKPFLYFHLCYLTTGNLGEKVLNLADNSKPLFIVVRKSQCQEFETAGHIPLTIKSKEK